MNPPPKQGEKRPRKECRRRPATHRRAEQANLWGLGASRGDFGRQAEESATRYLQDKGYEVLARNYHCRYGEIDIVARDGETLVFIEVKARRSARFGSGLEAVTGGKIRKIARCAQDYLRWHHHEDEAMRFDVIAFEARRRDFGLTHLKNAFEIPELG